MQIKKNTLQEVTNWEDVPSQ